MTIPNKTATKQQAASDVQFLEWKAENFRAVNKFYKRQKHKGSASGAERVFIAYIPAEAPESDIQIIAAVRLDPNESYYWLRSLYVDESLRGNNIGSGLLAFVNDCIPQDIHCFPYTHLESFYGLSGYQITPESHLPQPLQQLYQRYNRKGSSILIMSRTPPI